MTPLSSEVSHMIKFPNGAILESIVLDKGEEKEGENKNVSIRRKPKY